MTTIRVKENEPFEVAMRRFKRTVEKTGLLTELRAREYYEKPTTERKRKLAAAGRAKDIASAKAAVEQFQRQAEAQLTDQGQRMRSNLLIEIQKAVSDKAKAGGYTVVEGEKCPMETGDLILTPSSWYCT